MITRRAFQAGIVLGIVGYSSVATKMPTGTWSGVLIAGSQRLRLKLNIAPDGTANLFSPDEDTQPRPGRVSSSAFDRIEVEFPVIGAVFAGRIEAPYRIKGWYRQNGAEMLLAFERGEAALAALPKPPPLTDRRLTQLRQQAGSPALAAAAARRHQSPHIWVDGERAVGTGITVQKSDLWHLGSITKSMTATLVARLVESGALHWDETVGKVLKQVAPHMNGAYRDVTLRHLLCHRAGLARDIPMPQLARFSGQLADAREERKAFARIALAMKPIGPVGQTFEYSNNGYVIVGAMLEARLGRSWEHLIRAHLFKPFSLTSAGFGAPGHRGETDQPLGHIKARGSGARQARPIGTSVTDNPVVLGPAGRVHMGLRDLLRYLAAHRDRSAFLRPETWALLHTPPFGGDYAMGWVVQSDGTLWHNGSNTAWYAEAQFDAAAGVAAAAACNDGALVNSVPADGRALVEAAAAV